LKDPVVWIAAISLFFVYFYYTGVTYTTPYLSGVLGASVAVTTVLSGIRTYGITLLSGPISGWIANKLKPSIVTVGGSLIFVVAMLIMGFLPADAGMVILVAVIMILLGFVANGVFSVASAQLTEGKVPMKYFGAATGILSVIGFLPDTFSSTWFGAIMDAQTVNGVVSAAAYQQIFMILIGAAVIAAVASIFLYFFVKRRNAKRAAAGEFDEAAE
jgi:MFS family permease